MSKVRKLTGMVLAVMMLLSVIVAVPVTESSAAEVKTEKTGGGFPAIYMTVNKVEKAILDYDGVHNDAVEGAVYNQDSNTLTLTNYDGDSDSSLSILWMGTDFKLAVNGECTLAHIELGDSSLSITGKGVLRVNSDKDYGIEFVPYMHTYYPFSLSIEDTVYTQISGKQSAISFKNTTIGDLSTLATVGGAPIEGMKKTAEEQEDIPVTVSGGYYSDWSWSTVYLGKSSKDPEGIYGIANYTRLYDDGEEEVYKIQRFVYDEEHEFYLVDKDSPYYELGDNAFARSEFSYVTDDEGYKTAIDCNAFYKATFNKFTDSDGNSYVADWGTVYNYDEDVTVSYEGEDIILFTENTELSEDVLTAVVEDEPQYYYCYSYDGTEFVHETSMRGLYKGVYLDGEDSSFTIFNKNKHYDKVDGVFYDSDTNTLTLTDADLAAYSLTADDMGDDFTVEVKGGSALSGITVNDGSLSIIGDGALTIDSGAEYGITVQPTKTEHAELNLDIADSAKVVASGTESAFIVRDTTKDNIKHAVRSNERTFEVNKPVTGFTLSRWGSPAGTYAATSNYELDGTYCVSYIKTTMYNHGSPSYSIETFDVMKCYHDENIDINLADPDFETQRYNSKSELNAAGYELEVNNSGNYLRRYCSVPYATTANVYTDSEGNTYAVDRGSVYSYTEDNKLSYDGVELPYFQLSNSTDIEELTPVMVNAYYYDFKYEGTRFDNREPVETEPSDTTPVDTTPVDTTPVATDPVDTKPVDTTPVDTTPVTPTQAPTQAPTQPAQQGTQSTQPVSLFPIPVPTQPAITQSAQNVTPAAKSENTLTVKAKKVTVKANKKTTLKTSKYVKVSKAVGKVTYKKASGNKKITVKKNGKLTIKKGLKKGVYTVKIKISAAGSDAYEKAEKTVTVKIKVK